MTSNPECPEALGVKAGSVRLRYWPNSPKPTRPSDVSPANRDTASTMNLGLFLGSGWGGEGLGASAARSVLAGLSGVAANGSVGAGLTHSKNWSLALRRASGVLGSPTMY